MIPVKPLGLLDAYGLAGYELGAGTISETARGIKAQAVGLDLELAHGPNHAAVQMR